MGWYLIIVTFGIQRLTFWILVPCNSSQVMNCAALHWPCHVPSADKKRQESEEKRSGSDTLISRRIETVEAEINHQKHVYQFSFSLV